METEEIQELLEESGFVLNDRGHYWSTSAIWRNGNNTSAIQIYKDTGVWRDFVADPIPRPLKSLLRNVFGETEYTYKTNRFKKYCDIFDLPDKKVKIKMPKSYDTSILKSLLPHYKFYLDKKISENILKLYRCGLATSGKMNSRFVFPIFKENNPDKIIGFTGRSFYYTENGNVAKWKHIGQKKDWLYPCFIPKGNSYPFLEAVKETKIVYILESIGDSLAMAENGMFNSFVTFGVGLSSSQILFLSSLEPEKIVIVSNNDDSKEINVGKNAAIKHFVRLMDFFDLHKIHIKLPILNDLSDSHFKGEFIKWRMKKVNEKSQKSEILKVLKYSSESLNLPKSDKIRAKIEKLEFYLGLDDL
jgi:hypothetical protein